MSENKCSGCGAANCFEIDAARGDSVCTNCGQVQQSHASQFIVATVDFQEGAGGSKQAIGQFVGEDGYNSAKINIGSTYLSTRESKQITFQNAKYTLTTIAHPMHLPQHIIEMGFNFYKMCFNRSMTRGRQLKILCAACLYIACRLEHTSHLMYDFSQAVQADMNQLGRIYTIICKTLHINLPVIDPSIYIPRFADKLEFGEKAGEISQVATNLISGMKRDWMVTGRRPSGLCAAALLLAARLYGFHRTVKDILRVLKINKHTMLKRLDEFAETPTSNLRYNDVVSSTSSQLDEISHSSAPSSFRKNNLTSIDEQSTIKSKKEIAIELNEQKKTQFRAEILSMQIEIDAQIAKQVRNPPKMSDKDPLSDPKVQSLIQKFNQRTIVEESVLNSDDDDSEIESATLNQEEINNRLVLWEKINRNDAPTMPETNKNEYNSPITEEPLAENYIDDENNEDFSSPPKLPKISSAPENINQIAEESNYDSQILSIDPAKENNNDDLDENESDDLENDENGMKELQAAGFLNPANYDQVEYF